MKLLKSLSVAATVALVTACSSNAPSNVDVAEVSSQSKTKLPMWVLNPIVENGLASTQCLKTVADFNILKDKASALARADIARQINVNVKTMQKTYDRLTETNDGPSVGSDFESVSKQLAQESLRGSRAVNVDYVDFPDGSQKLCVMMTLSPETTESLISNIIKKSGVKNLSPQNEKVLYERFLAKKAADEMEAEFEKSKQQ